MEIKYREISVKELAEGYFEDKETNGVVGFGGKLNIRPKYQREFVYDEKKRNLVIDSINNKYPLNVFYWVKNSETDFEVLDGQQRSISICQYVNDFYAIKDKEGNEKYFHNLTADERNKILDYKLSIYWCEGDDSEKLAWFRRINVSGEPLNEQEMLNATYSGVWLTSAKKYFSHSRNASACPAYQVANKYIKGDVVRQEYLAAAISWINNGKIREYMAAHQHDPNANALWNYFNAVINWVESTFIVYRPLMKGVDWGYLYNNFKDKVTDTEELENRIKALLEDEETITATKGIYYYVFDGDEKHLSIRAFDKATKTAVFEKQNHKCKKCGKEIAFSEAQADHITPFAKGGRTIAENCQILCADCNRRKSDI